MGSPPPCVISSQRSIEKCRLGVDGVPSTPSTIVDGPMREVWDRAPTDRRSVDGGHTEAAQIVTSSRARFSAPRGADDDVSHSLSS